MCLGELTGALLFINSAGCNCCRGVCFSGRVDKLNWRERLKRPLHLHHHLTFSDLLCIPIFSIPYPLRSTVCFKTESYHCSLVPRNVYLCDEISIRLNPYTHIGHVRLSQHVIARPGNALSRPILWASSWYLQATLSSPGEAFLPTCY
jgi:hypothetical protein